MKNRMIFDVGEETQMAIRLRAVKNGWTTGQVVDAAIRNTFPNDIEEAKQAESEKESK